jgi:hypothetical protein
LEEYEWQGIVRVVGGRHDDQCLSRR